ncbi:MAG: molybdopterin oxidoreductase family protein [Haloechinothrix sp.]
MCHSPTGYGLNQTFGTSVGTQDFRSIAKADVIVVIGANPTDAHPVFASRMKRRLREGAELVVVDPRRIDLARSPHIEAAHHLHLAPGTNVAIVNAMAHVVVTEGLVDRSFVDERCEDFEAWAEFIARPEHSPEATEPITGVPAEDVRAAARSGSFPHELPGYRHVSDDAVRMAFETVWARPIMRRPSSRTWSCQADRFWTRTARSSTPSAGSTGCDR